MTSTGLEITRPEPFSGAPELASILLLTAGLLFIGSVQAAMWMRKHATSPSEMEEWYPHYFRESGDLAARVKDQLTADGGPDSVEYFWQSTDGWTFRQVGRRWYGAQVRQRMYSEVLKANRWANWARWLYHLGIVALLAGLTALVWPPHHRWNGWREVLLAVAALGTLFECIWILGSSLGDLLPHGDPP